MKVRNTWMDCKDILHGVGLRKIVTHANLGDDWFSHFCMVGVKFSIFPPTCIVVFTALQHYRVCQTVIQSNMWFPSGWKSKSCVEDQPLSSTTQQNVSSSTDDRYSYLVVSLQTSHAISQCKNLIISLVIWKTKSLPIVPMSARIELHISSYQWLTLQNCVQQDVHQNVDLRDVPRIYHVLVVLHHCDCTLCTLLIYMISTHH